MEFTSDDIAVRNIKQLKFQGTCQNWRESGDEWSKLNVF